MNVTRKPNSGKVVTLSLLVFFALFILHSTYTTLLSLYVLRQGQALWAGIVSSGVMVVVLAILTYGRFLAVRPVVLSAVAVSLAFFFLYTVLVAFVRVGDIGTLPELMLYLIFLTAEPALAFALSAGAATLVLRLGWGTRRTRQ